MQASPGNGVTGSLRRSIAGVLPRMRLGAIQWLIVSAAGLVIAIMLGTGYFALQFRERTLEVLDELAHELLHRGWRRLVAVIAIGLGFWIVFESQSKSALALSLVAIACSGLILLLCRKTRLTPAYLVAAVVVASMFVSNPIERIAYRLYGDGTLTGRTPIWGFIEYQISHKPWFGWGFHSYYLVPNSPHESAPGYIREMPSSHSGYLELRLETGRIGYWIFMVFIYSSLHLLEYVRRRDPVRAWCYLSIQLFAVMVNLLDSNWLVLTHFWLLYLIIVAESVHYSWPIRASSPAPAATVRAVTPMRTSRRHI